MKREKHNNKYSTRYQAIPKHPGTYPFAEGNTISVDELPDRIPAYNTQGKEYKRHLLPLRDQKDIDTRLLTDLINRRTNGNSAELATNGLKLNQINIKIKEGLASCEGIRFRYNSVWDLILNLKHENILLCEYEDLKVIKNEYYK